MQLKYAGTINHSSIEQLVAERSEANNRDLWASESQLAFIYISISVRHAFPASGG